MSTADTAPAADDAAAAEFGRDFDAILEAGSASSLGTFVLTYQSVPISDTVTVDFDA